VHFVSDAQRPEPIKFVSMITRATEAGYPNTGHERIRQV
jgi:hypothetical protein